MFKFLRNLFVRPAVTEVRSALAGKCRMFDGFPVIVMREFSNGDVIVRAVGGIALARVKVWHLS